MKIPEYTPTVGDRVKTNSRGSSEGSTYFTGEVIHITSSNFSVKRDDGETGSGYQHAWEIERKSEGEIEIIKGTKTTSTMSLISKYKNLTRKEPEKTFVKAGVMNESLELTSEGQALFMSYLLEKNADTFKKDVVDAIVAEMESEEK